VLGSREPIKRVEIFLSALPENLDAALGYWKSLVEGEQMRPRWSDFDLLKVPLALLPTTMVYDIKDPFIESRYRYWGTGMTALYGKDNTGEPISSLIPVSVRERLANALAIVCKQKAPNAHTPHFTNKFGKTEHQCILRLPIFDQPGVVTKVVTLIDSSPEAMEVVQDVIGEMIDQDLRPED
jgi:hypothetical protein